MIMFLVVFRLEEKNTDVVVSMNYPVRKDEEVEMIHTDDLEALMRWIDNAPGLSDAEKSFKEIIETFKIVDWSLFDEDEEE